MNLTVRPAEEADADFLVWAMMTAATSHLDRCVWSTLCGFDERATADLLRRVLRRGPAHWCHLERFLVVESEGDAIAAASSFEPATQGTEVLTEAVLGVLGDVGMDEESVAAMLHRSEVLDAVTPKDYADAWGVENVAVRPDHRGRGAVERLFEVALEEGRAAGKGVAQIMCLVGNDRAQSAWERNGFVERADYRSRRFATTFGCDGMKLLVQSL